MRRDPDPDPEPDCSNVSVTIEAADGGALPSLIGVWTPNDDDNDASEANHDDTNDFDDLPKLKATGSPAGGTYSWSLTNGAGKLSFIDPATKQPGGSTQEVLLQGAQASAALNDVEITATHTTPEGCEATDMLELTVILATLTFRPMNDPQAPLNQREQWSANSQLNNHVLAYIDIGAPFLGFIRPDSPPGARGFHKNMEIQIQLQPCVPGLPIGPNDYDIKRLRNGRSGTVMTSPNGVDGLVGDDNDCPQGSCPDDPHNDDEDLKIDPPADCDLFSIDSPGFAIENLVDADQDGDHDCVDQALYANQKGQELAGVPFTFKALFSNFQFREWLDVHGRRASNTRAWHAKTEVGCVDNAFAETDKLIGNIIGQTAQGAPGGGNSVPTSIPARIHDTNLDLHTWPKPEDLMLARVTYVEIVAIAQHGTAAGDDVSQTWEDRSNRYYAIHALGRFNTPESISTLVNLLNWTTNPLGNQSVDIHDLLADNARRPAVDSLARIGDAAIPALLERVDTADEELWTGVRMTLDRLDRQSLEARAQAQTMLERIETATRALAADGRNAPAAVPGGAQPVPAERARIERMQQRLRDFLESPEPRPRTGRIAPPARIPGDLDADGVVGAADLRLLLLDVGVCEACPADLTRDGRVDGADLLALITRWGEAHQQ